ncbi:MAG: PKD domain-containing protein [Armatimonadetes bacterium]|nr:PKD domain-containing protein [Armatimonadota bacterium]
MDRATLSLGETCDFTAVATLDGKPLDPADLTWEWDFGDKSELCKDNPAPHAYTAPGEYLVTVAAFYQKQSTSAKVTVIVEGYTKDNPTGPGTIIFVPDANGGTCDVCQVHCAIPCSWLAANPNKIYLGARFWATIKGERRRMDDAGPFGWVSVAQDDYVDENDVHYRVSSYRWSSQESRNESVPWEVEYGIRTMMGGTTTYGAQASITPGNSLVSATGQRVLKHHTGESHTINWFLSHLDYDNPLLTIDVAIRDIVEAIVWTWTGDQSPGSGSVVWDGTAVPPMPPPGGAQDAGQGIYTYTVKGTHAKSGTPPSPVAEGCWDQDKVDALVRNAFTTEFDVDELKLHVNLTYSTTEPLQAVQADVYDGDLETRAGEMFGDVNGQDTRSFDVDVAPDDACEPYSVVLSADQADGSQNRDGQPKPCLPKGWITMIPAPDALHVWGGWEQAGEVLRPSDAALEPLAESLDSDLTYYRYVPTSYDAEAVCDSLGLSGMGVIYCHTSTENWLMIAGSWSHDIIKPGSGTDVEDDDIYFTSNLPPLSRCHFLMLAGCHTASRDSGGTPVLLNAFALKGVDLVMGFEGIIFWPQMSSFLYYFTKLVHEGDSSPGPWYYQGGSGLSGPQPFTTAAQWAAEYSRYMNNNDYGGVNTFDFWAGGSDTARPAKWGE